MKEREFEKCLMMVSEEEEVLENVLRISVKVMEKD